MKQERNTIATIIGQGIIVGAAGVAGMLLSQEIEKVGFRRTPSRAPAEVADKVLGLKPANRASEAKFNTIIQYVYGSVWGIFRSGLGHIGTTGFGASALHLAALGVSISGPIPALGWVPRPRTWNRKKLAIELVHHTVYAFVTGWAYDRLYQ